LIGSKLLVFHKFLGAKSSIFVSIFSGFSLSFTARDWDYLNVSQNFYQNSNINSQESYKNTRGS